MQCAIVTKNNDVYLSFRGTATRGDILKDLNTTLANSGFMSGRVHRDFYTGFKDLWPQISEKLDKHAITKGGRIEDFNFNFTGHSMGGALAKISALYVKKEWNIDSKKMKAVTFGDPRTFDIKQAREYDSLLGTRTLRVTQSGKDPVPSALLGAFGFKHVGARLKTQKPQGHSPHLLEGYKKGLKALSRDEFIDSKRISAYYRVSQFFRVIIDFVPEKLRKALKNTKIALGKKSWHETLVKAMALEKKYSARTDTLTPDTAIAASKKRPHTKRGRQYPTDLPSFFLDLQL